MGVCKSVGLKSGQRLDSNAENMFGSSRAAGGTGKKECSRHRMKYRTSKPRAFQENNRFHVFLPSEQNGTNAKHGNSQAQNRQGGLLSRRESIVDSLSANALKQYPSGRNIDDEGKNFVRPTLSSSDELSSNDDNHSFPNFISASPSNATNSLTYVSFQVHDLDPNKSFAASMFSVESDVDDEYFDQHPLAPLTPTASVVLPLRSFPANASKSAGSPPTSYQGISVKTLDTKTMNYLVSRIFTTTYHTQAMCILDIRCSGQQGKKEGTVTVSEFFGTTVFGTPDATAESVLAWLVGKADSFRDDHDPTFSLHAARTETFLMAEEGDAHACPNGPQRASLSNDDIRYFADQRRILRRLIIRPRAKGEGPNDSEDDDFDSGAPTPLPSSTPKAMLDNKHVHKRTLEEGFASVLLPFSTGERVIATLYVSTIASQELPAFPSEGAKLNMGDCGPLLTVVSVVDTRSMSSCRHNIIRGIGQLKPSRIELTDIESGTVFKPNDGPVIIRSNMFTGSVFIKTVVDPEPDPRIQPYFEGKNRKFEIQMHGIITPPDGLDISKGTVYFIIYSDRVDAGWSIKRKIAGTAIISAFKMASRGAGAHLMKGDESKNAYPLIAMPLLDFADRLCARPVGHRRHPPNAVLSVRMLPESKDKEMLQSAKAQQDKQLGIQDSNPFEKRNVIYTISSHSQYLDFELWHLQKIPGVGSIDLHNYWDKHHPCVGVAWVPTGTPATELREKGHFLFRLKVVHESNR